VLKAIRRLDAAPEIPTSLAELAALSGVSRLRLVRRLLAAGRLPVDAALLAGFDQSHMTRAFIRQFGITPGRYRALNPPQFHSRRGRPLGAIFLSDDNIPIDE
jgi:transcriptional regulator GlxA family with amidase domain